MNRAPTERSELEPVLQPLHRRPGVNRDAVSKIRPQEGVPNRPTPGASGPSDANQDVMLERRQLDSNVMAALDRKRR